MRKGRSFRRPRPPGETTVERFVRERRHARDGYLTIERRFDETRFEAGE